MRRTLATTIAVMALLLASSGPAGAVTITEFTNGISAPDVGLWEIAAGPDGNVWFTERTGDRIGRITPSGVMTDFPAKPTIETPSGITAGPDGNIWVTAGFPNRIVRVNTSGTVTGNFTSGVSIYGELDDITTGPDGRLWFPEPYEPAIAKMTTGGVRTAYTLPFNTGPFGITTGPDGAMWFVEAFPNKIARIATNFTGLVESGIGITPDSSLQEITRGPDGNLWFTEFNGNNIGRMTTAGAVTEFPLPPGSSPQGITAGPDGNVWFAEANGDAVGRITPQGEIREFSAGISSGAGVRDITLGPDGNLWFTEYSGNRIGRVQLDPPVAATVDAVDRAPTTARLTATVNPRDYPTEFFFQYGTTAGYGAQTAAAAAGDGNGNVVVSAPVAGLAPETTYHFRVVARSRIGEVAGGDATFTTPTDPDRDRDGFARPGDCDDANAAIHPGARDKPGDGVDQDCNGADAPYPVLGSGISGFFAVYPDYTVFTALSVRDVRKRSRIKMRCRGSGCPFGSKSKKVRRATDRVNLLPRLKQAKLRDGVVFEVRVTKKGFVGRVARWKIRAPQNPARTDRCLPPGAKRPKRC